MRKAGIAARCLGQLDAMAVQPPANDASKMSESVAARGHLPVSCNAARRLIAGAFPMDSTMWRIALRTLARDEAYARISCGRAYHTVGLLSLEAARAHPTRALRCE
jgi:hypothetical protein